MKKCLIYTLILLLLLIGGLTSINAQISLPLTGKLIIIDPGHGGVDPGTVYGDIYEKDINLQISLSLQKELESYGASVILTREGDYDLSSANATFRKKSDFNNRIKLINESNADLYLSMHLNYLNDSRYYGPQVFYKQEDVKLATIFQQELNETAKSDRNIKIIPNTTYMYEKLQVPGLLIECGFLSNSNEREKLKSSAYQKELSKAISRALIKYFT